MLHTFKSFLFVFLYVFLTITLQAQDDNSPIYNKKGNIDIALAGITTGSKGNVFSAALSWQKTHGIALKKRFFLGYGVRLTAYSGKNGNYVTAPAKVTEGNFFKPQNQEKLDTLVLPKGQINSLNASIHLGYRFTKKLMVGFNIDVLGFSFGKKQTGTFVSVSEGIPASTPSAKVTSLGLLLTGDYDLGSLNSEIYAAYALNERLGLRAGLSFLFSEYTTTQKLAFDNDRFRRKTLAPMLALSYNL